MKAGQSRRQSVIEAIVQTVVAMVLSLVVQVYLFPWYGIYISLADDIAIIIIFTIVSFIRSFYIRRLFNYLGNK